MMRCFICLFSVVLMGATGCCMFGCSDVEEDAQCDAIKVKDRSNSKMNNSPEQVHPDSSEWPSLFDATLSNAEFERGVWYVDEKGRLTADKDQCIWTKRDYENFILDLEYACAPAANSGVLIYATDTKNWIPNTVEIQIQDDLNPHWNKVADTWRNGGLFGHLAPRVLNVRPAGEWNRMTVTAAGQKIKVAVNDEITVDADLSAWKSAKVNPGGSKIPSWLSRPWAELPTRGRIGFQGKHGQATIFFRNIKIKEL
jgi:hypothetical protein